MQEHRSGKPGRKSICANPPDRRRRDLETLLKPTLDLLVRHQVIQDDCTKFLTSLSISLGDTGEAGLAVSVRPSLARLEALPDFHD